MRSVPVRVYIKDKLEPESAGWGLGVWGKNSKSIKKEDIWGLTINNWPTQMCYDLKHADPFKAIDRRKKCFEEDLHPNWSFWFFDVGRKLVVSLTDLEDALHKLGIEREAS